MALGLSSHAACVVGRKRAQQQAVQHGLAPTFCLHGCGCGSPHKTMAGRDRVNAFLLTHSYTLARAHTHTQLHTRTCTLCSCTLRPAGGLHVLLA